MASDAIRGRTYVITWLLLMLLTGASLGLSYVPLGAFAPVAALGVAAGKATVVGLIFMHLWTARFVTKMVALINVLFVALLCLGIVADVAFR